MAEQLATGLKMNWNWKWLLGGLGIAGLVAYAAKNAVGETVVVDHAPEPAVAPNQPSVPTAPSSTTSAPSGWAYAPFIVEVRLRVSAVEKGFPFYALTRLRTEAPAFARRFADTTRASCPTFPVGAGVAPKSIAVRDAGAAGANVVVTWPWMVWSGSTPELTACILRVLRADANGDRVLSVVVR